MSWSRLICAARRPPWCLSCWTRSGRRLEWRAAAARKGAKLRYHCPSISGRRVVFEPVGRALAQYLSKPIGKPGGSTMDGRLVADTLAPGDVLLIEGNTRMSAAIKYLTQSMWSHAALF